MLFTESRTGYAFCWSGIIPHGVMRLRNTSFPSHDASTLSSLSTISAGLVVGKELNEVNKEFMKNIDLFLSFVDKHSGATRLIGNLAYRSPNQTLKIQVGALTYLKRKLNDPNESASSSHLYCGTPHWLQREPP